MCLVTRYCFFLRREVYYDANELDNSFCIIISPDWPVNKYLMTYKNFPPSIVLIHLCWQDGDGQQGCLASHTAESARPQTKVVRDREYYAWRIAELNHRVNMSRKLFRKRRTPETLALLQAVVRHKENEVLKIEEEHSPKYSIEDDPWVIQRKDVCQPPLPDTAAGSEGLTETYASCVARGPRMEASW